MSLRDLSNESLWTQTRELAQKERRVSLQVLWHIREVEARGLHLDRGYENLFAYVRRELGYSDGAAMRRINSMRLLVAVPEVEEKLLSGELNLSVVSQMQGFFKNEKMNDRPYSVEQKRTLLEEVSGKSSREVERVLLQIAPESVPMRKESQREITPELTEYKFLADVEFRELLERVKDIAGGANAFPDLKEVLKMTMKFYLSKKDPKEKAAKREKTSQLVTNQGRLTPTSESKQVPASRPHSRTGSAHDRRIALQRADYRCEFKDAQTGRRCEGRRNLEIDHQISFSKGGASSLANFQVLCSNHHSQKTLLEFG